MAAAATEAGEPVPADSLPPPIPAVLVPVREAFALLSRARTWTTAGPLPISMEATAAWMAMVGPIDPDDRMEMLHLLASLDDTWLSDWYRRRAAAAAAAPASA
ncbi:MAG: hypothetical protein SF002_16655 [Alphaproteobacteria bacterium]|nr:hypothetical protein [Alphaproteobacteria bacterium]